MQKWTSFSQVRWECRYHVVIMLLYRQRGLCGRLRHQIGPILRELCPQTGTQLLEGHCMPDHIHSGPSTPPKHNVAYAIGFSGGKNVCGADSLGSTAGAVDDGAPLLVAPASER